MTNLFFTFIKGDNELSKHANNKYDLFILSVKN